MYLSYGILFAMMAFRFEIVHRSTRSRARVGRIHTPHGMINTPGFVAVGTHGTVKALPNPLVEQLGVELMFCNTYHLLLQPGPEVIAAAGGLHRFIHRRLPLITDSGGFQVFSLAYGSVHSELKSRGKKKGDGSVLKISEEGVLFRSYRDGRLVLLTPESSIDTQKALGADIIIPFDELPPYHIDPSYLIASVERTHRWEVRSLYHHLKHPQQQAMYGVIHGGIDPQLRRTSCAFLAQHPFDGFAIGGSVGKNQRELIDVVDWTQRHIPPEVPIHLLGIGDLPSLHQLVPLGMDTFDSSYPTKAARHGLLFTQAGNVKILQGQHKLAFEPIERDCLCPTCQTTTRSYLHHLFKANELTAYSLATAHNLFFMTQTMANLRQHILDNKI